tara:strand:- start:124 stop:1044 length:921 start_codon:yes stop_codon:yes gene_type:complete
MVNKEGDCFKLNVIKGKYYSYTPDMLARDSVRLATFLTPNYQYGNGLIIYQDWKDGVTTYEKIKNFIDSYQKLNSCPSVNDLGTTYNALVKIVGNPEGLPPRIESNLTMKSIRDKEFQRALDYRNKYGTNQSSNGRKSERAQASINEKKALRGLTGGIILINISKIKQDKEIEDKRILEEKRIIEEKRVKRELEKELEEKRIIEAKRIKEENRIKEEKRIKEIEILRLKNLEKLAQIQQDLEAQQNSFIEPVLVQNLFKDVIPEIKTDMIIEEKQVSILPIENNNSMYIIAGLGLIAGLIAYKGLK